MKRRMVSLLLLGCLVVSSVACQNSVDDETASSVVDGSLPEEVKSEFLYVPEFQIIEYGEDTYYVAEGIFGNYYGAVGNQYDEASGENRNFIQLVDIETKATSEIELGDLLDGAYVERMYIKEDGNIQLLVNEYQQAQGEGEIVSLISLDATGTIQSKVDISELVHKIQEENGYAHISEMVVDENGNTYLAIEQYLVGLDVNGVELFQLTSSDWINSMGLSKEGNLYYTSYADQPTISFVNKETGEVESTYADDYFSNLGNGVSIEGDLLTYSDGSSCYSYNFETKENSLLFQWMESDIFGHNIRDMVVKDEHTIYALEENYEAGENNLITLRKTERSMVEEKEILTLATLNLSTDLEAEIVSFNKSNENYRITVKEYIDETSLYSGDASQALLMLEEATNRMILDLSSTTAPDLVAIEPSLPTSQSIVDSGALVDLTPYLGEVGYTEDDFVDGLYDKLLQDGKLYYIPDTFALMTMFADASVVGNESGWSIAEAVAIANELPEGMEFMEYATKQSMLETFISISYDSFIDENSGTASYDSEEFRALLSLANSFPEDYTGDYSGKEIMIQEGKLLLYDNVFYEITDYQVIDAVFADTAYTAIGFPGVAGNGAVLTTNGDSVAVTSNSKDIQAAVDFVVSLLGDDNLDYGYSFGFPVLQNAYDEVIEKDMTPYYMTDKDGEYILDENGNRIEDSSGGIGMNGFEVTYYAAKQEEVDAFENLLKGAETVSFQTDRTIYNIITEEAGSYFSGQKTLDEVVEVIQNRVTLYLNENN